MKDIWGTQPRENAAPWWSGCLAASPFLLHHVSIWLPPSCCKVVAGVPVITKAFQAAEKEKDKQALLPYKLATFKQPVLKSPTQFLSSLFLAHLSEWSHGIPGCKATWECSLSTGGHCHPNKIRALLFRNKKRMIFSWHLLKDKMSWYKYYKMFGMVYDTQ